MNNEVLKAKKEFDNKNYENALKILDDAEIDDVFYKYANIIKTACFMNLKRYDKALNVIDEGIEKYPNEEFFRSCKVKCHYFNGQKDQAIKSLSELEPLIDKSDKDDLVSLADKFEMLGNHKKALEYCDMALDIDENFVDAVSQKSMVASSLKNHEMMNECADKLLEIYDKDVLKLMIPFMLKLTSKNYRGCREIIDSVNDVDEEHIELLKGAIHNQMIGDLKVEIRTLNPVKITVDEVLGLLFDYYYEDIASGQIHGVRYFIKKSK